MAAFGSGGFVLIARRQAICKYLQEQVQAYVAIDADKDPAGCGSRWAKWLPPVQDVHKALCGLG